MAIFAYRITGASDAYLTSSSSRMACSSGVHSRDRPGSCRSAAADDAQAALPPPAAPPPPRGGRPLLTGGPGPGCGGGGGAHGADGPGGGGVQRGGAERDAAAAGELPALRALHLLRRAQGRLRPLPVLLRHQLQHPQPPLRILLLHPQVMRLPPLQRLTLCFPAPYGRGQCSDLRVIVSIFRGKRTDGRT